MRVIRHRHRIAALAAYRVYYVSHIEVLEPDHPRATLRHGTVALQSCRRHRRAGRPYDQEAEAFARALLMPREAVGPVIAWSGLELVTMSAAYSRVSRAN